MRNLNVPMYDPEMVRPMREELTRLGFAERVRSLLGSGRPDAATWEAVESYGECDDCFGGEHPDQIAAEDRLIVECRRLGHPLIIGGTCICGKRIG